MTVVAEESQFLADKQIAEEVRLTYRKVMWRLLPFLFLAYVINSIDRINISLAKLRMVEDLALSDAAYGLGVNGHGKTLSQNQCASRRISTL